MERHHSSPHTTGPAVALTLSDTDGQGQAPGRALLSMPVASFVATAEARSCSPHGLAQVAHDQPAHLGLVVLAYAQEGARGDDAAGVVHGLAQDLPPVASIEGQGFFEAGADDVVTLDDAYEIYTDPAAFSQVRKFLEG